MGLAYLLTYKMGEIYCRGSSPIRCIWDMIHRVFVSWFLHLLSKIQQHVYHEPPKPWKKIEVLATKKPRLFTINKPLEVVEVFSIPDSHGSYCLRPWICHRRLTYFGRCLDVDMDVSENSGTPKSSILIGFSIINHPFWGTPIFGNIQIDQRFSGLVGRKKPVLQSWTSPVISEVFVSFILVSQDLRDIVTFILHTAKSPHDQVLGSGS